MDLKNLKSKIENQKSSLPRVITAAILLPVLIASILISSFQILFIAFAAAAMTLGLYEFYMLCRRRELKPDIAAGFLAAGAIFTVFCFNEPGKPPDPVMVLLILAVFTAGTLIAATLRSAPFEKMIPNAGATVLGVLYVAFLGSHLVGLRTGFEPRLSTHLLSFFFLVVMGSDTAAYYVGRGLGKRKLATNISPGKTWEGVVGGLIAAPLMALLCHYWFFPELSLKWAVPLSLVMSVLGALGDLTESALKRGAGAKDAANILPGHGGLLDRLDSLLFNAPLIYYFARLYFDRI